jgi:septum formation protein
MESIMTQPLPLLLGSQSRYKRQQFQKLGFPFAWADPGLEEHLLSNETPREAALRLARAKAHHLRQSFPQHLIISGDQTLDFQGTCLSKPQTTEGALQQLQQLLGKTHHLRTAFCLHFPDHRPDILEVVDATLTLRSDWTELQLRTLIERDQTQDCVGGYKFESYGIGLFESVVTTDPTTIIGLPLMALNRHLCALQKELLPRFSQNP